MKETWQPKFPNIAALGANTFWIAILSLPMLAGQFLAGPTSDQYRNGFAYRRWAADMFHQLGRIPEWNPEHFGGLPFIAAQHGDIFYPSAWIRWVLPTDVAMNLTFSLHYILAGFFLYLLARSLRFSWTASLTAGLAYQLAGVNISLVHPGHDGKLFVVAVAPLALWGLVRAIKQSKLDGYFILSLAVGLALLSPQYSMAFYLLLAAGLFSLYLVFIDTEGEKVVLGKAARQLGAAFGAVLLGWGIGSIGILPLYNYVPFSPRSETAQQGFEWATSYAIPWSHVPELLIPDFVGRNSMALSSYWGPNGIKFHSEYIGLPVLVLAAVGALWRERKTLALSCLGIAVFFMLIALGANTPFYSVWYELIPFVRQTRAPGMALYAVTLFVALLAAIGVQRLEEDESARWKVIAGVAGAYALLAVIGVYYAVAEMFAAGLGGPPGPELQSHLRFAPLIPALATAAIAFVIYLRGDPRVKPQFALLAVPLLISADLWISGRNYWVYSNAPDELHATDEIIDTLKTVQRPFRVHDINAYSLAPNQSSSVLMGHEISQLLGHHAFELHRFDEVMGGQDVWTHLYSYQQGGVSLAGTFMPTLDLYAVNYVTAPQGAFDSLPGFDRIVTGAPTAFGRAYGSPPADLYRRRDPIPWARVIPAGVEFTEPVDPAQVVVDPRFPLESVVVLPEGSGAPSNLPEVPPPSESRATVEAWEPGRMTINISPAPQQEAFLLIAENWYPDWRASSGDTNLEVVRMDHALLGVRVPAGTERVSLEFRSDDYRLGRMISLISVIVVVAGIGVPVVQRRRSAAER